MHGPHDGVHAITDATSAHTMLSEALRSVQGVGSIVCPHTLTCDERFQRDATSFFRLDKVTRGQKEEVLWDLDQQPSEAYVLRARQRVSGLTDVSGCFTSMLHVVVAYLVHFGHMDSYICEEDAYFEPLGMLGVVESLLALRGCYFDGSSKFKLNESVERIIDSVASSIVSRDVVEAASDSSCSSPGGRAGLLPSTPLMQPESPTHTSALHSKTSRSTSTTLSTMVSSMPPAPRCRDAQSVWDAHWEMEQRERERERAQQQDRSSADDVTLGLSGPYGLCSPCDCVTEPLFGPTSSASDHEVEPCAAPHDAACDVGHSAPLEPSGQARPLASPHSRLRIRFLGRRRLSGGIGKASREAWRAPTPSKRKRVVGFFNSFSRIVDEECSRAAGSAQGAQAVPGPMPDETAQAVVTFP